MAESVDALDSKSSVERREGSSPSPGTTFSSSLDLASGHGFAEVQGIGRPDTLRTC